MVVPFKLVLVVIGATGADIPKPGGWLQQIRGTTTEVCPEKCHFRNSKKLVEDPKLKKTYTHSIYRSNPLTSYGYMKVFLEADVTLP